MEEDCILMLSNVTKNNMKSVCAMKMKKMLMMNGIFCLIIMKLSEMVTLLQYNFYTTLDST